MARLCFLPFVDADAEDPTRSFTQRAALLPRDTFEEPLDPELDIPAIQLDMQSLELKYQIDSGIRCINIELEYDGWSDDLKAELVNLKQQLFEVRNAAGDYATLSALVSGIVDQFAALTNFQFRFE